MRGIPHGQRVADLGQQDHQPCHRHRPSAFSNSVNLSNLGQLFFGCEALPKLVLIQDLKETSTGLLVIHYVHRQLQVRPPTSGLSQSNFIHEKGVYTVCPFKAIR